MPSALERCFSYCETSAPETKALSPSPFSTITRTSGSCSKRSSAFGIASHMSIEMAFLRAGLLNVSQPIGPCFSATMRSPRAPVARAGCLRRARSSSWVMSLVFEAKTAIVSRAAPARQRFPASFGLCAGIPYHARQSLRLAAHAGGEFLGRIPDDLEAVALEPLAHLGQVQRAHDPQPPVRRPGIGPDHPRERRQGNERVEAEIGVFAQERHQPRPQRRARDVVRGKKDGGGEREHCHRIHADLPFGFDFEAMPP